MNTSNAPATNTEVPATPSTEVTGSTTVSKEIAVLAVNAKPAEIVAKINEIVVRLNAKRDRGPDSKHEMSDEDAKRVMLGDLKDLSHTKAAEALGLSYGQVYSARKGFTFKGIYKEMERLARKVN